jgi:hypothetical protein
VYFGPQAPEGKESNWIQTIPGKGFSMIIRLYGPLEPWFDQTWQPGEVVLMDDVPAVAPSGRTYRHTTDIPAKIPTPDRTDTRIGAMEFFNAFPSKDTVARVYDNLDFMRGTQVYLSVMQGGDARHWTGIAASRSAFSPHFRCSWRDRIAAA